MEGGRISAPACRGVARILTRLLWEGSGGPCRCSHDAESLGFPRVVKESSCSQFSSISKRFGTITHRLRREPMNTCPIPRDPSSHRVTPRKGSVPNACRKKMRPTLQSRGRRDYAGPNIRASSQQETYAHRAARGESRSACRLYNVT